MVYHSLYGISHVFVVYHTSAPSRWSNATGDCVTAHGAPRGHGRGRGNLNWSWNYPSKEAQQLPGQKALALEAQQRHSRDRGRGHGGRRHDRIWNGPSKKEYQRPSKEA